ncbi:TRASH domain-containing protein [uncultured Draconibacterium sp.]
MSYRLHFLGFGTYFDFFMKNRIYYACCNSCFK